MLQQIVEALHRQQGVDDWIVRHVRTTSNQYYVVGSQPENRRSVSSEKIVVTVMNDHPGAAEGAGSMRGQANVTLVPSELHELPARLEEAVFMARLADNPPYGAAEPAAYPNVDMADAEMQTRPRQVAERLLQQLVEALVREKTVRLSSAEVFVDTNEIAVRNSRGIEADCTATSLLLDFVLLASNGADEMEAHIAFSRRRAADLDVPAAAQRQAQYARDALTAEAPRTGTFPVVVSDDALSELLMSYGYSPLASLSSAEMKYQRLSPWEVGQSILTSDPSGDPFTMYSNALLPFGVQSRPFDDEGLPGQRMAIVQDGVLARFWATQRYADYLHIPPTGGFANMEIAPGSVPFDQLLDAEGTLYHIVAFSAMSPDPITGDFVGEIRLGYEIHNGKQKPIRGGSISGNLFQVLAAARLSREQAFLGDYLGPRAVLFPRITVAGT